MLQRKNRTQILLTLLVVTALALSGCHEPADPGDGGTDGGTDGTDGSDGGGGPITIGGLFVLSGDAASLGESARRGMELARDEINAAGGINGRDIQLTFGDTKLDPTEGTRAFQNIIGSGDVPAVIGALASGISAAVIGPADENEVVLMSPASTRADLTSPRQSEFFFRTIPSDVIQGTKAASLLFQDLEMDSTVVMFQNNAYATGLKNVFVAEYGRIGGTVTGEPISFHEDDETTYAGPAQDAVSRQPGHIWIAGQSPEIAHLIKELRSAGYQGAIMTSEAIESPDIFEIAPEAVDGVLFTKPEVDTDSTAYQDFASAFEGKFGSGPGPYSAYAYDALYVIAHGLKAGKTTGPALREHIQDGTFTGRITNPSISFNQNGDVAVGSYVLWTIDSDSKSFGVYDGNA